MTVCPRFRPNGELPDLIWLFTAVEAIARRMGVGLCLVGHALNQLQVNSGRTGGARQV